MADYKSDIITKVEAVDSGKQASGLVNGDDVTGVLLLATVSYTLTGSEAANDTIQLVDIPAGAVIVPQNSYCTASADPGTTLTLKVGDSADDDRYASGIVMSAGGIIGFCSATMPAAVATPYRIPSSVGASRIIATVASANTLTAAVKLVFTIAYRVKG